MSIHRNPYIAGNPVGGKKQFVGRDDILSDISRILENPDANAIVLYGQRRIGKTSILQELSQRLRQESERCLYIPVDFDFQDKANWKLARILSNLTRTIIATTSQLELGDRSSRLPTENITLLTVLRWIWLDIQAKFGPKSPWEKSISAHEDLSRNAFIYKFLPQALNALPPESSLVFLFDEFDVLATPHSPPAAEAFVSFLPEIMGYDRKRLQFVIVMACQPDDLTFLARSIFKDLEAKRISLLTHDGTKQVIRLSEQNGTLSWSTEAITRILDLTNGHPYLTQQLCAVIWDNAYQEDINETPHILPEIVDQTIPKTFERSANTLHWIWDRLDPAERVVAWVVAGAEGRVISQDEIETISAVDMIEVTRRELKEASKELKAQGLLESVDSGYRFRVELLRRWVVQFKPLSRVKEELNRVEPIANRLYQIGKQFYDEGNLEEAVPQVERALQRDSHHFKARLLLGKIWLEQGKLLHAIEKLEKAHQDDPVEAGPYYVRALLTLAQQQAQMPHKQFESCRRILQVEPRQRIALNMLANIAAKLGCDEALIQNDLPAALKQLEKRVRILQEQEREQKQSPPFAKADEYQLEIDSFPRNIKAQPRPSNANTVMKWGAALVLLIVVAMWGVWFLSSERVMVDTRSATLTAMTMLTTASPVSPVTRTPTLTPIATATPKPSITATRTIPVEPSPSSASPLNRRTITEAPHELLALQRLNGHTGPVWSLAFTADSTRLVSGAHDTIIHLWDVEDGQILQTFTGHTDRIWSIALSPDGAFLASASQDAKIYLWDMAAGRTVKTVTGHIGLGQSVAFSPHGYLAYAADGNRVHQWSFISNRISQTFTRHNNSVFSVAFSPDGTRLASADADHIIHLWDVANGQLLQTLSGHKNWVRSVAFSPDGTLLASASYDNTIRLWNLADGKTLQILNGHTKGVNSVAFSPDGTLLASGSDDHTIRLWDVKSESLIKTLEDNKNNSGRVLSVAISPDGTRLASGSDSGTMLLWGISSQ